MSDIGGRLNHLFPSERFDVFDGNQPTTIRPIQARLKANSYMCMPDENVGNLKRKEDMQCRCTLHRVVRAADTHPASGWIGWSEWYLSTDLAKET